MAEAAHPRVWLDAEQLASLPIEGAAWDAIAQLAQAPIRRPTLRDQDSPANVATLALALYAARTGDAASAAKVRALCLSVPGTERGARALAVARELAAYVIAADLVGIEGEDGARFSNWLRGILHRDFQGRSIVSTHEQRPNNWGTHAGATRIAIAVYLEDRKEIERAAEVFSGWLGGPEGWQQFEFGATSWQPWGLRNYGINPAGATLRGHSIDGVLPDDQRRGGAFRWPPPKENYVYEALQGAVTQAMLLERQGFDVWNWGDRALLRAFRWLHEEANYPARGDDVWMVHVINRVYGTRYPAASPTVPGKGMGFTDWTHGSVND